MTYTVFGGTLNLAQSICWFDNIVAWSGLSESRLLQQQVTADVGRLFLIHAAYCRRRDMTDQQFM